MEPALVPPSLSVSIITYLPDLGALNQTLLSLEEALAQTRREYAVGRTIVLVIDNGPGAVWRPALMEAAKNTLTQSEYGDVWIISGQGNVGYGRGHNLAMAKVAKGYLWRLTRM